MNNQEPISTSDYIILASTFLGSMLLFSLCYKLTELVCLNYSHNPKNQAKTFAQTYLKFDDKQRADFNSRITSQIHAFISISLAIHGLFFTCVDPENTDSGYSNFFTSDYCLQYHSSIWQMITLCFSAGYLTLDTYLCYALIKDKSSLQTQTYIHHAVGISGCLTALIYGAGGALIVANVLLVNEFSTFFLNYRQFIFVMKAQDRPIYTYNAIAFFISFLLFRIIFNTIVSYWIVKLFIWTTKDKGLLGLPLGQLIIGLYLIFLFVAIYILNLIWFVGLIKLVKKSFRNKTRSQNAGVTIGNSGEIEACLIEKNQQHSNDIV